MKDTGNMYEAIVAIATIVDDTATTPEGRLEGIRGVLAAVGMLRVGIPRAHATPTGPRLPPAPIEGPMKPRQKGGK